MQNPPVQFLGVFARIAGEPVGHVAAVLVFGQDFQVVDVAEVVSLRADAAIDAYNERALAFLVFATQAQGFLRNTDAADQTVRGLGVLSKAQEAGLSQVGLGRALGTLHLS